MKNSYLIAANWKQNGDLKSSVKLINDIIKLYKKTKPKCDVLILPPSIYLSAVLNRLIHHKVSRTKISLGSQNISSFENGAYTGELSVDMIKDYCTYTLIGHSERRHIFLENDQVIREKFKLSVNFGMKTILCVGETMYERNKKLTKKIIFRQLSSALSPSIIASKLTLKKIVIAYEPVWAIGTGKTASLEDIKDVHSYIRRTLNKILGAGADGHIKILYGGSVNNINASSILSLSDVNGALVGGASLNSKKFIDICSSI